MPPTRPQSDDVTLLMAAAAGGDKSAADRLLPLVYDQLRKAAQLGLAGERAGHTLQATAIVHEAYLKLVGPRDLPWQGRAHFYAAAAEAMRRVLLDHAKARGRVKRGGGLGRIDLDNTATLGGPDADDHCTNREDFIALDDAIGRLASKDPRMAEVVRLRFYAGLEISQVASALGVSERTVKNDWAFAKAWLERELKSEFGIEKTDRDEREKEGSS
jgi:RNA polymerase sigma factor (TIGR02999 family)